MSYGYNNDERSSASLNFGLNQKAVMTKFEFNPNGGKDGAAQECLDIVFEFPNGTTKNYRQFPVTKAKDKNQNDITDPRAKEMIAAFNEFNAKITQIMKCFVTEEEVKQGLSTVSNFKSFCQALVNLLPSNWNQMPIDIFCQYQWQPKGDYDSKFVELPTNVKQGKVFVAGVADYFDAVIIDTEAKIATYKEVEYPVTVELKKVNFTINDRQYSLPEATALIYVSEEGELHPISRTSWFMKSNWAKAINGDAPIQSSWE